MKHLISFLAIAAVLLITACSSSSEKQGAAQSSWDVSFAQGEPIVLAPHDTIAFGVPQKEPIVVDFWADWCPPCKEFSPIFHKVAKKYKGKVRFISVNVDSWSRYRQRVWCRFNTYCAYRKQGRNNR